MLCHKWGRTLSGRRAVVLSSQRLRLVSDHYDMFPVINLLPHTHQNVVTSDRAPFFDWLHNHLSKERKKYEESVLESLSGTQAQTVGRPTLAEIEHHHKKSLTPGAQPSYLRVRFILKVVEKCAFSAGYITFNRDLQRMPETFLKTIHSSRRQDKNSLVGGSYHTLNFLDRVPAWNSKLRVSGCRDILLANV